MPSSPATAHSSGDRVMAENYLQHAEHYNRIIAAAQAQMPIQNMQNQRDGSDDDLDDDRDEFDNANNGGQGNMGQGGNVGQANPGQGNYQGGQNRATRTTAVAISSSHDRSISGPSWGPGRNRKSKACRRKSRSTRRRPRAIPAATSTATPLPAARAAATAVRAAASAAVPNLPMMMSRRSDGLVATLSRGAPVAQEPAPQEPVADTQGEGGPTLIDADN